MDTQAHRKALFRARLKEASQKRDKRIDSPLVRYDEDDQPLCRVCNVILKSESFWLAHQASRKHHEAIENIKAAAACRQTPNSNSQLEKRQYLKGSHISATENFVDGHDAKRQKTDSKEVDMTKSAAISVQPSEKLVGNAVVQVKAVISDSFSHEGRDEVQQLQMSRERNSSVVKQASGVLPIGFFDRADANGDNHVVELAQEPEKRDVTQLKQVKGALPAGFFDNKDADLRARGIEPVRVDVEDAYKEFEKEIQEDLQGVDDRMEEEEIDAAEVREEIESLEQKAYRERVDMVKKKLIEAKASRVAKLQKSPAFKGKESSDSSSGDEDDTDENFAVDWRAKRL
ncbi:hypothetical protein HPP92_023937 [Vanilla planifolia]|uniref:C2H2-type domain-containing protein n=1 Tax=Vanilla planifolia TaxID=51239 RepID=A0A835PR13_VANPL|nr:hypothetical protein HPP92_023937 [Vanilla planifolia]